MFTVYVSFVSKSGLKEEVKKPFPTFSEFQQSIFVLFVNLGTSIYERLLQHSYKYLYVYLHIQNFQSKHYETTTIKTVNRVN